MSCLSTISNLKSRKFLGKTKKVFGEIDPQLYRFLSAELSKDYVQKKTWGSNSVCRFLQNIWFYTQREDLAKDLVSLKKLLQL